MSNQKSIEVFGCRMDPKNEKGAFALFLKPGFSPEDYAADVKHVISIVRNVEALLLLQDDPAQVIDSDFLAELIGQKVIMHKDIALFDADFSARADSFEREICNQYDIHRVKAASKMHKLRQERRK